MRITSKTTIAASAAAAAALIALPTATAVPVVDRRQGLGSIIGGLIGGLFSGTFEQPRVTLEYGTFQGVKNAPTNTNNFLGIPFAKAGRLENPTILTSADKKTGVQDASKYGYVCPQAELIASPLYAQNAVIGQLLGFVEALVAPKVLNQAEDCLNINVQTPANVRNDSKLPVVVWLFGGGFELGGSAAFASETTAFPGLFYQGANIVQYSQELKQDVVFVSFNYRLNAFGGLAGKEMQAAGLTNLHIKDQRAAFEWIQRYISKFGGDPSRVTVFGESAGAQSIGTHMVLDNGSLKSKENPKNKLFSGAWMFSGGAGRFDPADGKAQQRTFDALVQRTGCAAAQDKIACLKKVSFPTFYSSVQGFTNFFSYSSVNVPWYPHPDGTYLTDSPAVLASQGKIADIPFVIGDMRDEGTLFALFPSLNVTTDADFKTYLNTAMFPNATADEINQLATLYPNDPALGSPYGTGQANQLNPQFKRLASVLGDMTFQADRRTFLANAPSSKKWSYLIDVSLPLLSNVPLLVNLGLTNLPILGSFHVSDAVLYIFGLLPRSISANSRNIMAGLIRFANTQDPSPALSGTPAWPTYDPAGSKSLYDFKEQGPTVIADNFRVPQMQYIASNPNKHFNF